MVFGLTVETCDHVYKAVLDKRDTLSIVARGLRKEAKIGKSKTFAIRVVDGRTIHSLAGVDMTAGVGNEKVTKPWRILDTDAFDIVIGIDFGRRNPKVKLLSLPRPSTLHCIFRSGFFYVPLELSEHREHSLSYMNWSYRNETHQLLQPVLKKRLAALQVDLNEAQFVRK